MSGERAGGSRAGGRRRAGRRRSPGQSLVEFALVIPLFLLLFMAIVDFGSAVFTYNSLTNAAREGARLAIVNQDTTSVVQRAEHQVAIAEINAPNVTVNFYQQAADGTPDTSSTCSPAAVGCLAVVSFEATYHPLTPIIGNLLFKSGVTFTAKSVLTVEYSCPNSTHTAAQCPKQP
jgi:Flp pilus assembly protein TadG